MFNGESGSGSFWIEEEKKMSKHLGLNPYLPFWETVPDGEPHVFDGRIYIYGSHDKRNGTSFCEDDYVCWSAPVDDLGNWKYEGVIYKKTQDPINGAPYDKEMPEYEPSFFGAEMRLLYAPDVTKDRTADIIFIMHWIR